MKPTFPILMFCLLIFACKEPEIKEIVDTTELVALVEKNGEFGYINPLGEYLFEVQYEEAFPFSEGMACVNANGSKRDAMKGILGGEYAMINLENHRQFNGATFKKPIHFVEGFALVNTSRRKKGMLGLDGNLLVKEFYTLAEFSDGFALGEKSRSKKGYIDTTGKVKIELGNPSFCGNFYNGLACVESRGKYGFIDSTGGFSIKPSFDIASDFIEDRAAYIYKGKYGFIDKSGETIINPEYEDVADFSSGLCGVQQNGKWGFIDLLGRVIVDFKYEGVGEFHDGLAAVRLGDKMGFINKKGVAIVAAQYSKVFDFYNGFGVIEVAGLLGFIDKKGEVVVSPQFTTVSRFLDANASNSSYICRLFKNTENED